MLYIHGVGLVKPSGYYAQLHYEALQKKQLDESLDRIKLIRDREVYAERSLILDKILNGVGLMNHQKDKIKEILFDGVVLTDAEEVVYTPKEVEVHDYSVLSEYHKETLSEEEKLAAKKYYEYYFEKNNMYPYPQTDFNKIKTWHDSLTQEHSQ